MAALITAHALRKSYNGGPQPVEVLRSVDFEMADGEVVGIYGASGAGKSTLLHVLSGLDRPDAGTVMMGGVDISGLGEADLARMRNRDIGFVFQFYHLLPEFSAIENVMLPCLIAGESRHAARERARQAIDRMGLAHRAGHRPGELSGGEQQRVAVARAAVMKPRLICADEPTGNLDRHTGNKVWEYLIELQREMGVGMIVVSHNHDLLQLLPRLFELKDGELLPIPRD